MEYNDTIFASMIVQTPYLGFKPSQHHDLNSLKILISDLKFPDFS